MNFDKVVNFINSIIWLESIVSYHWIDDLINSNTWFHTSSSARSQLLNVILSIILYTYVQYRYLISNNIFSYILYSKIIYHHNMQPTVCSVMHCTPFIPQKIIRSQVISDTNSNIIYYTKLHNYVSRTILLLKLYQYSLRYEIIVRYRYLHDIQ